MPVILGGPNARRIFVKGEIVVALQYVNGEPAMVLYPRDKRAGSGAFVIPLESAWKYKPDQMDDESGNQFRARSAISLAQCIHGAHVMKLDVTQRSVHKLYTVIVDHLDDLYAMPPEPSAEQTGEKMIRKGEIVVKQGGRTIAEHEVKVPLSQLVAEQAADASQTVH